MKLDPVQIETLKFASDKKGCGVEGCGTNARSRGFCNSHYQRWKKYGSPIGFKIKERGYKLTKPRISSHGRAIDAFIDLATKHHGPECLIWPFFRDDLGRAKTARKKGEKLIIVSRVVCERIHGAPFPGAYALHSCGKSHEGCVSGAHLYWGTAKQNTADAIRHGTFKRGVRMRCKLTEEQIRKIRRGNLTYLELKSFGVTLQNIDYIMQGKTWKDVEA